MDLDILKIASDTKNNRVIQNYTHSLKLKNSLCGDEIQIKIILKKDEITDFGYQGKSCVYCQASASLLSKISINNKKKELNELCDDAKSYFEGNSKIIKNKWLFLRKLFKKNNISRKECLLLPFKTLKKIVSN